MDLERILIPPPTIWTDGVPNLHQVFDKLWRCGQPTSDGWKKISTLGEKVLVVKLNKPDVEGDDIVPPSITNIQIMRVPLPPATWEELVAVPQKNILLDTVHEIDSALHQGMTVVIHCTHGHDRTGLITALCRVFLMNWKKWRALKEAIDYGFHWELVGLLEAFEEV